MVLDGNNRASGELFWDDGESIGEIFSQILTKSILNLILNEDFMYLEITKTILVCEILNKVANFQTLV